MPFSNLENTYRTLPPEQQLIVYNLAVSLYNLNQKLKEKKTPKRKFGKFAGIATAHFSDSWEISEEELCDL